MENNIITSTEVKNNSLEVKFKKLDINAITPTYAHEGDMCMDMVAIGVEYNEMMDTYIYHTGLAFETPFNYGQLLLPRSSNRKTDVYLANSVGIADSAIYRGEICFCYKDRTSTYDRANTIGLKAFMNALSEGKTPQEASKEFELSKDRVYKMTKDLEFAPYKVGDKIGQMMILPYPTVKLVECQELSDSSRGTNGFGSTGN